MCGISGIVWQNPRAAADIRRTVRAMGIWLHHRGPDGWGEYATDHVGLGHNRLAILDLEHGQQPMASADARLQVIFNGEIYNYRDLWRQLEAKGHAFRTDHSDTEVLVNGYLEWGEDLFARLDGMFAIAVWDGRTRRLVLARDPMGIKPLYFAELAGGGLAFASEPKALIGSGLVVPELRPEGLGEYFLYRAPVGPGTLWKNIHKLQPGTWQDFELRDGLRPARNFWRPAVEPQLSMSFEEAQNQLGAQIDRAVSTHLIADVPVGVFLSGGVDSSLVAAAMARHAKLKAFTIGSDFELDETEYAATVARHLGLPFYSRRVRGEDYLTHFEDWVYVNDDPSADPSALALMMLAASAREQGMKVMLAGEGGDELFGGYNSYLRYAAFLQLARLPAAALFARLLQPFVGPRERDYCRMIGKGLHFLGTAHLTDLDARGQLLDPELWPAIDRSDENAQPLRQAMLFDQRVRLPNDLLMRTDRASMYFSLEARVPLLANELIEWANRLPDQFCVRLTGDKTKPLLKHLAATLVPPQVIHRPKRGFDLPLWSWLNTSFRELQHQLLSERAVPFLNYAGFNAMVEDLPRDQSALTSGRLWAWIVLEKWYRLWTQDHGAARPRCPAFAKELPAYPLLAGAAQQPV